jgi:hypothetical protein
MRLSEFFIYFLGRTVTLFLLDSKFLYIEVVDFVKIG